MASAGCLQALTLCPRCAHEQGETAKFCTHCGAALHASATADAPETPEAPSSELPEPESSHGNSERVALVRDAVLADVRLGRELLSSGRPDVARFVFANALAVSSVEPAVLTLQQGEQLVAEFQQCEQQLSQSFIACPICGGSGRRALKFDHLTGETGTVVANGQTCSTCRGSGKIRKTRSADDLKHVLGQARRQSDQVLQARGRIPQGGAWIPALLAPLLDDRTEAHLRKAAAEPCATCRGIGRTDCGRCGNTGFVVCSGKGCEQGLVIREELNRLDARTALRRREPCGTCGGNARVACPGCRGMGALTCKACGGTGRRPPCTACGGEGTATCRACRGKARNRDGTPCLECASDGMTLCPTCHGDGKRNR